MRSRRRPRRWAAGWSTNGRRCPTRKSWWAAPPISSSGWGLLLVYFVLAGQYESWITPGAVILAVPLALLGTVGALQGGRPGQQHLCPDRAGAADRALGQERDSDRRDGPRRPGRRQEHHRGGRRSRARPVPAHSDDFLCLHPRACCRWCWPPAPAPARANPSALPSPRACSPRPAWPCSSCPRSMWCCNGSPSAKAPRLAKPPKLRQKQFPRGNLPNDHTYEQPCLAPRRLSADGLQICQGHRTARPQLCDRHQARHHLRGRLRTRRPEDPTRGRHPLWSARTGWPGQRAPLRNFPEPRSACAQAG